jgi:protein involved in polysaccharide export with SLBB domain
MRASWAWVLVAATTGGCSTAGARLSLFADAHRLLPETEAARQTQVDGWPRELDKRPGPPFTVEPGDVLLVQPIELDSPARLPGDQPILPDGTIHLGRYGPVQVAGRTLDEVALLVQTQIEAQTPNAGPISVRLIARQSKVYYVLGAVNSPGSYLLHGRETVLDGILAAGGLSDRASRDRIILARPTLPDGCRIVLPVCFREIVQLGDTTTNYQLLPGDRIFVPTEKFLEDGTVFRKKSWCACSRHVPCPTPSFHPATLCRPASSPQPAGSPLGPETLPPPANVPTSNRRFFNAGF